MQVEKNRKFDHAYESKKKWKESCFDFVLGWLPLLLVVILRLLPAGEELE
jgi:hypothetical protein